MGKGKRRRKIAVIVEENSNNENVPTEERKKLNTSTTHGPMHSIMYNIQSNQTNHSKYVKEMQKLYSRLDHDAFMYTFIRMIKSAMQAEEANDYAKTTLLFCAKYVTSYETEDTHPVMIAMFNWLLTTISDDAHIRFRLCQFVNMILNALGPDAALDDCVCDNIMTYMISRLRDMNTGVRVQAILALQRLQTPTNPDDLIVKTYLFHLSSDPSPKVRQAVITSIGKNFNTIPYLMERLWDVDEKVRRHAYLHMSSVTAKAYKVSQRLTFLEQGFSDRSEMVRKVVMTVLLPQWLGTYNNNFVEFISALKLDANETEMDRFRKITKVVLPEMFSKQKIDDLVKILPLETEGEFYKCIPFENLTVELSLYWLCLIEYLQSRMDDELDLIVPELSVFCSYVQQYCKSMNVSHDKWEKLEHSYIVLTLMEILSTFDLGDEIGRENLKQLLSVLLKNHNLDENVIKVIARCSENLITDQETRLQFFIDIITELTEEKNWNMSEFNEILEKQTDKTLKLKLSSLKVKILDLREQEMNFVEQKEYVQAQKIADERNACCEEYCSLVRPSLSDDSASTGKDSSKSMVFPEMRKVTMETIIKCLQISFHMIVSKKVKSLTPNVCNLYKEFIRRHIESIQTPVRDWALKCGTAFSMLYDQLSKDVYNALYEQFFKNQNTRIWKTSIDCIFELLDRYGFAHFEIEDKQNKSRKAGRLLYSTDYIENDEDTSTVDGGVIFMMSHFLDTCEDVTITSAVVNGFCRLVLHGHIKNDDIMEKLLLKYFNPATGPEINQILGVFFENLITKKKQELLQRSLLPTVKTILGAPYDSPLHEIKPETVIKFVIDSTRPIFCNPGLNIHNTIAMQFMQEILNNISSKELVKILAKELVGLEIPISEDSQLKNDLLTSCERLLQSNLESKTCKYMMNFKDYLEGKLINATSLTHADVDASDEIDDERLSQSTNEEGRERGRMENSKHSSNTTHVSSSNNVNTSIHANATNKKKNDDQTALKQIDQNNKISNEKGNSRTEEDNQSGNKSTSNTLPEPSDKVISLPSTPISQSKPPQSIQQQSSEPLSSNLNTPQPRQQDNSFFPVSGSLRKSLIVHIRNTPAKTVTKSLVAISDPTSSNSKNQKELSDQTANKSPENQLDKSDAVEQTLTDASNMNVRNSTEAPVENSVSQVEEEVPPSPQKDTTVSRSTRLPSKRNACSPTQEKNGTKLTKTSGDEKTDYPSKKKSRPSVDFSDEASTSKRKERADKTNTPVSKNKDAVQNIPKNQQALLKKGPELIIRTRSSLRREFEATNTITRSKSAVLSDSKSKEKSNKHDSTLKQSSASVSKAEEKNGTRGSTKLRTRRRLISAGHGNSDISATDQSDIETTKKTGRRTKSLEKSITQPKEYQATNTITRSKSTVVSDSKSKDKANKHDSTLKASSASVSKAEEKNRSRGRSRPVSAGQRNSDFSATDLSDNETAKRTGRRTKSSEKSITHPKQTDKIPETRNTRKTTEASKNSGSKPSTRGVRSTRK